jgi:hypothetical protein
MRRLARMRRLAPIAVLALVTLAGVAEAHQSSFTYGRLTASHDGRRVDYQLEIRTTDLYEALGGASGDDPSDAVLQAAAARLYDYVAARVDLSAPGQRCQVEHAPLSIRAQRERFVVLDFTLACPEPIVEAILDYELFFDLDEGHVGQVTVDGDVVRLRAPDDNRLTWTLGGAPVDGLGGFVALGIKHIRGGLDHIMFLLALLLIAAVRRGVEGTELRPLGAALRYTAAIVTAFTLAHSTTLIAAALGWFDLPSRLVESVIAGSIVYVAIENLVRIDPPRRYLVAFGFGLIHGLGFAAMLSPLLPPDRVILPLLAFNLGVELGQLALVALALPVLHALARALGPVRYRRRVIPIGAVLLGSFGAIWLVERAFAVRILGL